MAHHKMSASYQVVLSWRDFACLACGDSTIGCPFACRAVIDWGDSHEEYSFPVCSTVCGYAWGDTLLEAVAGNKHALHQLVEHAAGKSLDD